MSGTESNICFVSHQRTTTHGAMIRKNIKPSCSCNNYTEAHGHLVEQHSDLDKVRKSHRDFDLFETNIYSSTDDYHLESSQSTCKGYK